MNDIGGFIAKLRKEQGMTQQELADKLCVTDKAVCKWECGKGTPDVDSLERLSQVLGVSVSELFAGKRDESEVSKESEGDSKGSRSEKLWLIIKTLLIAAGVIAIVTGMYLFSAGSIGMSFSTAGSGDGPTAVFVAAKPSHTKAVVLVVTGVVLVLAAVVMWCVERRKKKE